MRYIEKASAGANLPVFKKDSRGVLQRHVVAGEGHHLGTKRRVKFVQWSTFHEDPVTWCSCVGVLIWQPIVYRPKLFGSVFILLK
jgi:hypothetical protein